MQSPGIVYKDGGVRKLHLPEIMANNTPTSAEGDCCCVLGDWNKFV